MTKVTKEDVLRTADLARITLTEEEANMYSEQLTDVLTFADKIKEINTEGVVPTTNGNSVTNVLREDEPKKWDERDKALENAPELEDKQFKVPAIMD